MGASSRASLTGDLHIYPFGRTERRTVVASQYQNLLGDHEPEEILCVTRLHSEHDLTESVAETLDGVGYPRVASLSDYATDTLQTYTPRLTTLSDHERIELLAAFLDEHEWESEYLATAAEQNSFQQDIGALLIEMESRNSLTPTAYQSTVLKQIASVGAAFQSQLAEAAYVDRPSLIPRATTEIENATETGELTQSISKTDVILVADFEEFAAVERGFLAAIANAAEASVVAVAERDSRLLSSWREAGSIEALADGLSIQAHHPDRETLTAPAAVGEYLATGDYPGGTVDGGDVVVLERGTFREQITAVADEIERLCRTEDYEYDDITIAYQDSSGPVEETIQLLHRNGVPTTTVAVSQFGNDPAVKELADLTKVCAEGVEGEIAGMSRDRLLALESVTPTLLKQIAGAPTAVAGLWDWLAATDLKHRIGSEWTELDTKEQFQHVKEVLQLAEFLDTEAVLDGSWASFNLALERAFRYSSSRLENINTDHDGGGVPVGTIYGLKHASSKAVFLLNVTDDAYPSIPDLTSLLPTRRLQAESAFPMLTSQSVADVTDTFRPVVDPPDDPFHAYFSQVSRRLFSVGARTAEERLYLGVPSESGQSLGDYLQPSRFLSELVDTFEFIEPLSAEGDSPIASHGGASEFVVEHVDDTLEAVRRASVGSDTIDLDAYDQELAAIDQLLDQPDAAPVTDALAARIAFRRGLVRRD